MTIRVAYFTHYSELYGANRSLLDLMLALRENGLVEPLLFSPEEGPLLGRARAEGIPTYVLPWKPWMTVRHYSGRPHHRILQYVRYTQQAKSNQRANRAFAPQVLQLMREHRVELIHVNSAAVGIVPVLLKSIGLPVVWHIRELPERHYRFHVDVGRWRYAQALRTADRAIVISEAVRQDVHRYAGSDIHTELIYNGVLSDKHDAIAGTDRRLRWSNVDPFIFLIAGVIHPAKGQVEAIKGFALATHRCPGIRLWIAGAGKLDRLRALVAELDLGEDVEFLGHVEDLTSVYAKTHALLVCSRNEAMGRVTVEAMGSGAPVIGYADGGTVELIQHEENGLLYSGGEAELAHAMLRLVNDPGLARDLGEKAAERSQERFGIQRCAGQVAAVYQAVLAARHRNT